MLHCEKHNDDKDLPQLQQKISLAEFFNMLNIFDGYLRSQREKSTTVELGYNNWLNNWLEFYTVALY